jgi:hypothetical protein
MQYLTAQAQSLTGDDDKAAFLALLERKKESSSAIEFMSVMVGLFGVKQAWTQLSLSSQIHWASLWSLTKAAGAAKKKSILWLKPNAEYTQGSSPFTRVKPSKSFDAGQISSLAQLRGQVEIAAGAHFSSSGVTVLDLAAGQGIDAFLTQSSGSTQEVELAIGRLSAHYTLSALIALHELIETLEGLLLIANVQENMPRGPIQKRQMEAALAQQRTQLATESSTVSSCLRFEETREEPQEG